LAGAKAGLSSAFEIKIDASGWRGVGEAVSGRDVFWQLISSTLE